MMIHSQENGLQVVSRRPLLHTRLISYHLSIPREIEKFFLAKVLDRTLISLTGVICLLLLWWGIVDV